MQLYAILAAIVIALIAGSGIGGYVAGRSDGRALEAAEHAKVEDAIRKATDEVVRKTAEQISKIEVRNVTIRQKAETVTREIPVYRDCQHDPDGLRLINEALAPGAEPVAGGELPRTDAAD